MKYDFDTPINRRGTDSMKWDVPENQLPMWVGDMDFKTAPEIIDALRERVEHGVFGYSVVPKAWYEAYSDWWGNFHGFYIEHDWLVFSTGVIPTISSCVRKLTTVGENILVQTPVYNIFFNSIVNNGRHIVENRLVYKDGRYSIDFADLEEKLKNPQTTMMILCNPHNPVGKIWDRETLSRIGELCAENNVTVLSDEIHCDIVSPGKEYIPFASVSDTCRYNSVTCIAPTKTFNIAGSQGSAVVVPNENLRHKVERALNTDEIAEPNSFAVCMAVAAFTKGKAWRDEMCAYIDNNKRTVSDFLKENLPEIKAVDSEATYFSWIDCSDVCPDADELCAYLKEKTGLFVSEGGHYGESGRAFIRLNTACSHSTLIDGLHRLHAGVEMYVKQK